MTIDLKTISRALAGGAIGGALYVVTLQILVELLGQGPVVIREVYYEHVTEGALWGLLMMLPVLPRSWWQRGLLWGAVVAAIEYFLLLPGGPYAGLMDGESRYLFAGQVLAANLVWGLTASLWYRRSR